MTMTMSIFSEHIYLKIEIVQVNVVRLERKVSFLGDLIGYPHGQRGNNGIPSH